MKSFGTYKVIKNNRKGSEEIFMKERSRLFNQKFPFDSGETDEIFLKAVRENCRYQYDHCRAYRRILEYFGFTPEDLKEYEDLKRLPFLPTWVFKNHVLFSMPEKRMLIKATSSGTKGKFSQIGFELSGLWCGLKMVIKVGKWRKLFSLCPAHYIVLGYKPHKGNHTAVTKTAYGATCFTPALSRTFALKMKNGGYEPDLDGVIEKIVKHSTSHFPVRFMGFPSYLYFVLKRMEARGIFVKLPEGSKILLGGGWKQFYTQQVDKQVLYDLAKKMLAVEEKEIIEFFGAVEHPVLYCDCPRHHFHVPVYSRVLIRNADTLEPVEEGTPGLVNLITPMVLAAPVLSIMTDDLGVLHAGEECGCGIKSPYLEILGRVGLKDIQTCAAGAAKYLAGEEKK